MSAYLAEGSAAMLRLEQLCDVVGVRNVLYALAHIATEKSAHVEANWQDATLAKEWSRAASQLDSYARRFKAPRHDDRANYRMSCAEATAAIAERDARRAAAIPRDHTKGDKS